MEQTLSIFDTYLLNSPNSFDENLEEFNHNMPLFPHHVLVNLNVESLVNNNAIFASENGFFLKNDKIIPNFYNHQNVETYYTIKLRMVNWNRYFYTYKEARNGITYLVYTKLGFDKVRKYVYEGTFVAGKEVFDSSVVGAMTVYSRIHNDACTTILLSTKPLPHKQSYNIEERDWAPDTLNIPNLKSLLTRGFTLSLIHDFLKQTGFSLSQNNIIDYNLLGGWDELFDDNNDNQGIDILKSDKHITKCRYDELFYKVLCKSEFSNDFDTFLHNNYDSYSDELKDICKFLYPRDYKYTQLSNDLMERFRNSKLVAFTNIMMHIHNRGVTDTLVPYTYTYEEAEEFNLIFDSVTRDILRIKNKLIWLDSKGMLAMEYITGLVISLTDINETSNSQAKAAFAIWTYYMLYNNMQTASLQDIQLFHTLIYHVLGSNRRTFAKIIDKIKDKSIAIDNTTFGLKTSSWAHFDSDFCIGELICYFSNSFATYYNSLTDKQKLYLGKGCDSNADYLIYYKELVTSSVSHFNRGIEILRKEYSRLLFEYINEMLHRPDYSNKYILDIITNDD